MRRIAIIGAGPSGAIGLQKLLEAGFEDIVVYERHKVVGGVWNLDEHLGVSNSTLVPGIDLNELSDEESTRQELLGGSLYPQVETNVLAKLMEFEGRPFADIHPPNTYERFGQTDAFRTHDVIKIYISQMFEGKEKYVQLNTTVKKAWQPSGLQNGWELTIHNSLTGAIQQENFDFIYVATGKSTLPNIPNISGLNVAFKTLPQGAILHTKAFRNPAMFKEKKVVILGAGFSNVDVAHLLHKAGVAEPLHLSLRKVLLSGIDGFIQPWIETHRPITEIKLIEGTSRMIVVFGDGSQLEDVDHLILGTGYKYYYPFLSEYINQYDRGIVSANGRRTHNLFWSTWWKYDPTLAVTAGITDSVFWKFIEAQAKATAELWKSAPREDKEFQKKGTNTTKRWPSFEEMSEWEAKRNALGLKDFHTWYPDFACLFQGLAKWGGHAVGDCDMLLELYNLSYSLKQKYWQSLSRKWLEDHPDQKERLERTRAYLVSCLP